MRRARRGIGLVLVAAFGCLSAPLTAQDKPAPANPRFGAWKLKSDAPAPSSNIMTYEPFNGTGMKVTINAVNASGTASAWGYTTMLDGKDSPVTGRNGTDTGAVQVINDKINLIIYKRGNTVTQLLINVLSADNNTINVSYLSTNAAGETRTTTAIYERVIK
jgi:hypothetical protein